eukprot:14105823-Ditylum_brightwellii.AAC.1
MASSTIPTTNDYKPGSTMNIVQGDLVGQIIESGQDEMGQWVYTKLAAKNDKIITIIMAYQPCKVSKKNGIMGYHQQITMSQQAGRWKMAIKKEKTLFWELQLVDILDCLNRKDQSISLLAQNIIDYMFVYQHLIPSIRRSGYNRFDQ